MRSFRRVWSSLLLLPLAATWMVMAEDDTSKSGIRLGDTVFKNREAVGAAGARCATLQPTPAQRDAAQKAVQRFAKAANAGNPIMIPVQFIHVTNGSQGLVTESQRVQQVQVLNDAYAAYGFAFCYDPNGSYPPKTVNNATWFIMTPNSAAELACKSSQGVTPDKVLNFYTARPGGNLLGWATFPMPSIDLQRDGVVCLDTSLPGGAAAPFNLGDTATHEVGHWLGLFHTFEGGCLGSGDGVADTQAHAAPDFGCPSFAPSCNPPASSPVRNFMNYVDDACMDQFTAGQGVRMNSIVASFRPNLGSISCSTTGGCLLARLAGAAIGGAKSVLPFPISQDDMDGLRKFRDVVLNKSDAGRALSTLYYQHGPEMVELMLKNPQLAGETLSFLAKQMPAVERAVDRDGAVHLVQRDYDHGMRLLDRYRQLAPAELARTLTRVEGLIQEAVHPGNDVVTLKFSSASNVASTATLVPTPDPISTNAN